MTPYDAMITEAAYAFALCAVFGLGAMWIAYLMTKPTISRNQRSSSRKRWLTLLAANILSAAGLLIAINMTGIMPAEVWHAASLWLAIPYYGWAIAVVICASTIWPLGNFIVVPTIIRSNLSDRNYDQARARYGK